MDERPIIFSAEMVRAILSWKKTQTRRVMKKQPPEGYDLFRMLHPWAEFENHTEPLGKWSQRCPYGAPGDRLWVREKCIIHQVPCEFDPEGVVYYAADFAPGATAESWTPSIHMPRWASRITLEITDVRVQRLQDITADDAFCEGVTHNKTAAEPDIVTPFRDLWNSINAKRGFVWDTNPWVWVIEFQAISTDKTS